MRSEAPRISDLRYFSLPERLKPNGHLRFGVEALIELLHHLLKRPDGLGYVVERVDGGWNKPNHNDALGHHRINHD